MKICTACNKPKEKYYPRNNVCVECFRERRYAHRRNNPKLRMLNSARCRARKDGVPFNLTEHDFEIPDRCPVLGIPLYFGYGTGGFLENSPSLDRLRPALGYVRGNVAVISTRANRIKSDATLDEIKKLIAFLQKEEDGRSRVIDPSSARPS